jgi:phage tail sheath protein
LLLNEAFKRVSEVLLYRLNTGEKANVSLSDNVTAQAKYSGVRGNDITVTVKTNVDDPSSFDVVTFLDTVVMDSQTVKVLADLKNNDLVEFSGTGELQAVAGAKLTGGTDGTVSTQDYSEYFKALETVEFNYMALPVEDASIKKAAINFIKRMREDEGLGAQLVVADSDADSEAVINVKNGVILSDKTVIDKTKATVWVAAASANAGVEKSLTYEKYEDSVDVVGRLSHTETIAALQKGHFVFTNKRDRAVVEKDINSLVTITSEINQDFQKNRMLRTLDDIRNDTKHVFSEYFLGKVDNDEDGRQAFKANRIRYFKDLEARGAIEDFKVEDIEVLRGELKESVVVNVKVKPVDSMEKLYMTVVAD